MADWKEIIQKGVSSLELTGIGFAKDKKVKVKCFSRGDRAEVFKVVNTHYADLGGAIPENESGEGAGSDFTLKFNSTIAAKTFRDAMIAVINQAYSSGDDYTPAPSGGSPAPSGGGTGSSSGGGYYVPATTPSDSTVSASTNNNSILYIGIGVAVLLVVVVGLVIWKKRK